MTTTTRYQAKPSWLLAHLIRTGHVSEHGNTHHARIRTCPKKGCRDQVLAAIADTGVDTWTDPVPLSLLGEALAIVEGRATYRLRREGDGWVLDYRTSLPITHAPAGSHPRLDILRAHRCGSPRLEPPLSAPTSYPETEPPLPAGAAAPF